VSTAELIEWYAFSTLEPFGGDVDDLRDARHAMIQASAVGMKCEIDEFLLGEKPPPEAQTMEDMANVLRGIAGG